LLIDCHYLIANGFLLGFGTQLLASSGVICQDDVGCIRQHHDGGPYAQYETENTLNADAGFPYTAADPLACLLTIPRTLSGTFVYQIGISWKMPQVSGQNCLPGRRSPSGSVDLAFVHQTAALDVGR
jgi:hypothetical protein